MEEHEQTEIAHDHRLTRRRMLLGAAGAAGAAAFLAACGDDDDTLVGDQAGSATTAAAGGDHGRRVGHDRRRLGHDGAREHRLATLLEIDPASAGKGKTIDLGAVLALTGTGSFYGKTMSRGLDLAAKHIAELGGPTFKYAYLDHKSGDPAAGVQAMAEIVSKGIKAKFASYGDDITAMLSSTGREPGVHVRRWRRHRDHRRRASRSSGAPARSRPTTRCRACSSGPRRSTPTPRPSASSSGTSAPTTTRAPRRTSRQARGRRLRVQRPLRAGADRRPGLLPGAPEGQGQRARHPAAGDLRPGPGVVHNQAQTAGLKAIRIGFEYTPDGLNASKGTYDSEGWTFAYDFFDPEDLDEPAGQEVHRGLQRRQRREPRLLRRQLLRERVRHVGADAAGLEGRSGRRDHRRGPAGGARDQPHPAQRVRRRRAHLGRSRSTRRPTR